MKNEIENLDLMYGITIFNIVSQYPEFKDTSFKKLTTICSSMNDYFVWLNKQENVSSINVVAIGSELLKNDEIRSCFITTKKDVYDTTKNILKNFDFDKVNISLINDIATFGAKYEYTAPFERENFDSLEYIKEKLYSTDLLYKDLIMLVINNFTFPRRIKKLRSSEQAILFLNYLNFIFYHVDTLIESTREDLYYCVLNLLGHKHAKELLFPTVYCTPYDKEQASHATKQFIVMSFTKSLHAINDLYFIEVPVFDYDNSRRYFSSHNKDEEDDFLHFILDKLDIVQKIFMFKLAATDKDYEFTEQELKDLKDVIESLKQEEHLKITPQITNEETKKLITDIIAFVNKYCNENNLTLNNFIYTPNIDNVANITFLEFYISYNNYDYRFALRKSNHKFTWQVNLKNKKIYKINMYLEDDFKHLVQAIFND